ncbi:MAG: DNA-3-methyladenine glycosylase [bacterium]
MSILKKDFYNRDTLIVAKELLGCKIVRQIGNKIYSGIIVETEAYKQDDPACHSFKGKTPRASTLFKEAGLAYVYLIYGMYYCLNTVTEPFDTAGAVLIRALEPIENISNSNGPGKLCKALSITKEFNEIDLTSNKSNLWIEKYNEITADNIITTARIGIKLATDYPWRFYIKDNPYISKK